MGFGAILGIGLAGLFAWCATASLRERRGGLLRALGQLPPLGAAFANRRRDSAASLAVFEPAPQ